jgi:CheY-like chemotaxis protein
MYSQHALIVDDSRTAQLRLKRMLELYELEVDIAASAEEALAYLSYRIPAVIFLDQSMSGMNGIEALRTIKSNPNTATIPVIMYTSEKGEVFTSQARALGAIDVLYKSSMASTGLDKMLSSLKIAQRKKSKAEPDKIAAAKESPKPQQTPEANSKPTQAKTPRFAEKFELEEVHRQIARLFEIHITDVSRQISKSTQFLSKRLQANHETQSKTKTEVVVGDLPLDILNQEISAERRKIGVVSSGLLALVLLTLIIMGGLLLNMFGRLSALSNNYDQAVEIAEANARQIGSLTNQLNYTNNSLTNRSVDTNLLATLTWIANTDFSFGVNQNPLGEDMIPRLQQLTYQLADIGYEGLVEMTINLGNLCFDRDLSGGLRLAPNDLPVIDCIMRAETEQNLTVDDYLTLPYLSFEQNSPILRDNRITLAVSNINLNNPRQAYPFITDTTTAGDWNFVASQNNFISFNFRPYD